MTKKTISDRIKEIKIMIAAQHFYGITGIQQILQKMVEALEAMESEK